MQRRRRAPRSLPALGSLVVIAVVAILVSMPRGSATPLLAQAPPSAARSLPAGGGSIVASGPRSPTAAPATPGSASASDPAASSTASSGSASSTPVVARHVWWIVMENHEYGTIVGNPRAPYLNGLAARYGLATRYYATGHPSEPNYIALVAGSTLGVSSDGVYHLDHPSLFSQLAHAGRPWRVYAQNDRPGCFTGTSASGGQDGPGAAGTYARKHNPAISFTSVAGDPAQCRNIQPLRAFDPGAGDFEMIVPNLTNDMHDGSIAQGDAFLQAFVPQILASAAFKAGGVLFITFDEGGSSAGSLGDRGGHVATFIVSAGVARGQRYKAYADHWSLLGTTEHILGLPCLAGACRRSPIVG